MPPSNLIPFAPTSFKFTLRVRHETLFLDISLFPSLSRFGSPTRRPARRGASHGRSFHGLPQTSPVPARITQAIDETQLVRLRGNVHPMARREFDQGPVPDSQPLNRMLLVLQRSPEQEAALQKLMEEQ